MNDSANKRLHDSTTSFQQQYQLAFMKSLAADVSNLGYQAVSKELLNIIEPNSEQNQKDQIPSFEDNKISIDHKTNKYLKYYQIMHAQRYQKKIINDKLMDEIKTALNFPNFRKQTKSKINFSNLAEKHSTFQYLFSPIIINRSDMTSKYDFLSLNYIEFIRKCQTIQNALFSMIQVTDNFSINKVTKQELKLFIDHYKSNIRAFETVKNSMMSEKFNQYYSTLVTSYFTFFLTNFISNTFDTKELVFSDLFQQFIDMDNMERQNNPLTTTKTLPIYSSFQKNDKNKTEKLSMDQLKVLDDITFSDSFLERLFEEKHVCNNEMNFDQYIYFYIALNNLKSEQAVKYFFPIFDMNHDGQIEQSDITYFYKEIYTEAIKAKPNSKFNPNFDYFLSQLFDVIGCKETTVTAKLLLDSNNQDLFFKLLFDINTFTKWETDNQGEEEEEDNNEI